MPDLKDKSGAFFSDQPFLKAQDLTALRDSSLRQLEGAGGTQVKKFGDRYLIDVPNDQLQKRSILAVFAIIGESYDYLICRRFGFESTQPQRYDETLSNDTPPSKGIYVAKPYLLQATPWNGQIVGQIGLLDYEAQPIGQRRAGGIIQKIDMPYLVGDIIVASFGATGVSIPDSITYTISYVQVIGEIVIVTITNHGLVSGNELEIDGHLYTITVLDENQIVLNELDPEDAPDAGTKITKNFDIPVMWTDINNGGRDWKTSQAGGIVWPRTVLLQPQEITSGGDINGANVDNHGVAFTSSDLQIPDLQRTFTGAWYTGFFPGAMCDFSVRFDQYGSAAPGVLYALPYLFHEAVDITSLAFFNILRFGGEASAPEFVGVYDNIGEADYGYYYPGNLLGWCQPTRRMIFKPDNWDYQPPNNNEFLGYSCWFEEVNIRLSGNRVYWFVFRGPAGSTTRVMGAASGLSGIPIGLRPIYGLTLFNLVVQSFPTGDYNYTGQNATMGTSLWFSGNLVPPGLPDTFPKRGDFAPNTYDAFAHMFPYDYPDSNNQAVMPICWFTFKKP